jgi:S-DNA-T family DNA segregation ATPase FtsK/SpoIIIE
VDAIRVSIEENRVSTSLLQRKLGIGYSRAAKIIDRMEEEGLVSKPDGAKPRNILISAEQFIERYVEGDAGKEADEE